MERTTPIIPAPQVPAPVDGQPQQAPPPAKPRLEPTRYGDWELNGKCVDF